jgi:hypothetical protein
VFRVQPNRRIRQSGEYHRCTYPFNIINIKNIINIIKNRFRDDLTVAIGTHPSLRPNVMAFNLPPRPGTYSAGIPVSPSSSEPSSPSFLPGLTPVRNFYNRFWAWREQRGLPNPGSAENLQKEVKGGFICLQFCHIFYC